MYMIFGFVCSGVPCTDITYMCADGTCLKKPNPHCDFVTDCPDASDETQCGEKHSFVNIFVFILFCKILPLSLYSKYDDLNKNDARFKKKKNR